MFGLGPKLTLEIFNLLLMVALRWKFYFLAKIGLSSKTQRRR